MSTALIWLATSVTPACGGAIADTGTSATQLTAGQAGDLRFMREEEKLARDVYQALGETWEVRAFDRIATAEQRHMDAMLALLEGYAVADPSSGRGSGDFQDATLAALYTQLVARGRTSLVEALRVGAEIEELDLSDLAARTAPDLPADIAATYANLARGSRNHLRAFHALLTARGETYTPTHLAQADYDAIVSSPRERGDGSCMGQGRGRHGGMGRGRDPGGMGQGGMGGMGQGGMGQGRGPRGRGQGGMGPCNGDAACDGPCDGSGACTGACDGSGTCNGGACNGPGTCSGGACNGAGPGNGAGGFGGRSGRRG